MICKVETSQAQRIVNQNFLSCLFFPHYTLLLLIWPPLVQHAHIYALCQNFCHVFFSPGIFWSIIFPGHWADVWYLVPGGPSIHSVCGGAFCCPITSYFDQCQIHTYIYLFMYKISSSLIILWTTLPQYTTIYSTFPPWHLRYIGTVLQTVWLCSLGSKFSGNLAQHLQIDWSCPANHGSQIQLHD